MILQYPLKTYFISEYLQEKTRVELGKPRCIVQTCLDKSKILFKYEYMLTKLGKTI